MSTVIDFNRKLPLQDEYCEYVIRHAWSWNKPELIDYWEFSIVYGVYADLKNTESLSIDELETFDKIATALMLD